MWLELQIFGFRALWSPYFLLFLFGLGVAYFLVTGPYRHKFGGEEKPTHMQQFMFLLALVLLYAVKGAPIDLLSHMMLTAHMMQMAVYYLIFPILVIKSIPVWIWKKFIYAPMIKPVFQLLTKPLISLLLFNGLFSLYHIPAIFDFAKSSQIAHTSVSLIILIAAFIVWWPLLSPIREMDKMRPLLKIFYIFANGVLITPACVLIIFADEPLFAAYSQNGAWLQALALCVPGDILEGMAVQISGPEMFSPMSTLEDQQLGGIIMKIMQEITYGIILARVFFKWFTDESLKVDPIATEVQHSQ
ncbi:protein CtaG [Virgibacillus pantothenticus]|uniref:Cytochrome C oxidase assembly protein n=1 Tax=Virgibacillus pantothenticus TaxID=1473 RepID=A0A0L0QN73_VIRPA|nr:cytochrome c oxidase assembly factor CtaG [Virgibacillus pantothenticus]KNE20060.1 cytochrome C oxidase assembly protein [Virgibacillus pantothenticus]MBU8565093.1 cytochrome c oxidase assembly factor CtaG [Virgibacillus pantothenticus]MBU8601039.1 cytochrome c oxidase assembly factor CtaG [Virgibacillus pantothenticus]MBU8633198.1 cytochrome c oxidase assembly factor CtaG [Virgibacillus pantothenticus]MBU8643864.1 cytochrome c oxidase assembly factor CtaG [Virgibacillus pantothenticus]